MRTEEQILKDVEYYINRILDDIPLEHREKTIGKMKEVLVKKSKLNDNMMYPDEMSDNGLIALINHKFLHSLGLALARDLESNTIIGCMIAPDGKWEYTDEVLERNREKYNNFLKLK